MFLSIELSVIAPSPPRSLSSSDVGYVTTAVEWIQPEDHNGIIDCYLITLLYEKDEVNKFNISNNPNLLPKYIIHELAPNTLYTVEVRAKNDGGISNPDTINITTLAIG